MLTVPQTAMASLLYALQIWRVSCTKECHAKGPPLFVSPLDIENKKARSNTRRHQPLSISSTSYSIPCTPSIVSSTSSSAFITILITSRYHWPPLYPLILISQPIHASTHRRFFSYIGHFLFITFPTYIIKDWDSFFSPPPFRFVIQQYVTTCFLLFFCI